MLFGDFMMGAKSRLLPMSIPFRFFMTAVVLHVMGWAVLLKASFEAPGFMGGLGHVLGSLHFITLGVLAMTGMGAAFQLLPVATKRPVRSELACKIAFWLMLPGVFGVVHGMGEAQPLVLVIGGGLVVSAMAIFAVLMVDNLRQVKDMRVVTDQAWVAVGSLVVLAVLGLLLAFDFQSGFLKDHQAVAAAHAVVAGYGFMGMLVMGFTFILVPMFALTPPPPAKLGQRAGWLAGLAVVLAFAGLLHSIAPLVFLAGAVGLTAAGLHLWAMAKIMKSRMRKQLGGSFLLIRLAWGLLPVSIIVGLLAEAGVYPEKTAPLFGFLLIFGWLLTFLTGVLQRIIPFLASMHSVKPGIKPVLVSVLTAERPLQIHLYAHGAALLLVSAGLLAGEGALVAAGAVSGVIGAVAFLTFAVLVLLRLRRHLNPVPTPSESEV